MVVWISFIDKECDNMVVLKHSIDIKSPVVPFVGTQIVLREIFYK